MNIQLNLYIKSLRTILLFSIVIVNQCSTQTDIRSPLFSEQQEVQADSVSSEGLSNAEILIAFSQVIEGDKARLGALRMDSSSIEPTFLEKSLEFYHIDILLDSLQKIEISPVELFLIEQEHAQLEGILDFMLERRRSISQQIKTLELKIEIEQEVIDFAIKGETANIIEITEQDKTQEDVPKISSNNLGPSDTITTDNELPLKLLDPNKYNWQIVDSERELKILKAKFEIAKKRWLLLEHLLALNQDDLTIIQSFIHNTTNQLIQWDETIVSLENRLVTLQQEDSPLLLQEVIKSRIEEMRELKMKADNTLSADSGVINNLEARIERLSSIKPQLSEEVADATKRIERKNRWLDYLRSPFAPHRIYSFLVNNLPRIVFIILLLFLVWAFGRWLTVKILNSLSFSRYYSKADRKERIETLSRAIRSGLTVVMLFTGFAVILSEFGIDISVLLGGAAVISLTIAFGAQSLIKDYFSGFMILTENQYRVGNVIRINQISGVVEDISLRITILRDLEGIAHFIPHGEITTVSNLTHQWSRVALDVGVAYKENVDRVMKVIMEIAQEMQEDEIYKKLITDKPEMLGVDAFADSSVIIKVLIKTKPLQQWLVKREFLRRLKNRFDELGIEIPFPHRTIYLK